MTNILSDRNESSYEGRSNLFYNFGFKRNGQFEDTDIVTIHPASKSDPTCPGMNGTEAIRSSRDFCNPMLTFSVVYWRIFSSQGFETLDIECDSEETYFILLRGFYLLKLEAEERREELLEEKYRKDGNLRDKIMNVSAIWKQGKSDKKKASDPIEALYDPIDENDPMSAFFTNVDNISNSEIEEIEETGNASFRKPLPPAQFLGWNTAGTQIWARLIMAGLEIKPIFSWDLEKVILKIRCPQWRLEEIAEFMHMRLKNRDGTMKRFKVSRRETFISAGGDGTIFRSSERQLIIDYIIRLKIKDGGAELDHTSEIGRHIKQRFPLHMESKLNSLRHKWVTFWKLENPGVVSAAWSPLSTPLRETFRRIKESFDSFQNGLLRQPLDNIAEYFGEDVAFYFALLSFYTRWLIFPSLIGFFVFCFQVVDKTLDHVLCIPYAIIVMIWACFLLAFWRQKSSAFAHRWGVLDYEVEEAERPEFYGNYEYDDTTGEVRKVYPQWKRTLKYMITVPVIGLLVIVMILIMSTVFYTQDSLYQDYMRNQPLDYMPRFSFLFAYFQGINMDTTSMPPLEMQNITSTIMDNGHLVNVTSTTIIDPWKTHVTYRDMLNSDYIMATFLYPCIYGVIVDLMAKSFERLGIYLNDFENHRTTTVYMNRLVLKVFSFQFITVFTSLYYYAFVANHGEASYMHMAVTIFSLMTVGQYYAAFMELFLPSILYRISLYRMKISIANINRQVYKAREYLDNKEDSLNIQDMHSQRDDCGIQLEKISQDNKWINKRIGYVEQSRSRCWEESLMFRYTTFSDYTHLVVQLGFVLLFSIVFPLAPLLALLNNICLIRLGAIKICYLRQRPIAKKVGSIGVYEDVLQVMSVAGIITNCGIMTFTSVVLRLGYVGSHLGQAGLVLLMFTFEHLMLLFKYWLHVSVPRVPPSILRAQSRDRHSLSHGQSRIDRNSSKQSNKKKKKTLLSSAYDMMSKRQFLEKPTQKMDISTSSVTNSPSIQQVSSLSPSFNRSPIRLREIGNWTYSKPSEMHEDSGALFDIDVFSPDQDCYRDEDSHNFEDENTNMENIQISSPMTNSPNKKPLFSPHSFTTETETKGVRFSTTKDHVYTYDKFQGKQNHEESSEDSGSSSDDDENDKKNMEVTRESDGWDSYIDKRMHELQLQQEELKRIRDIRIVSSIHNKSHQKDSESSMKSRHKIASDQKKAISSPIKSSLKSSNSARTLSPITPNSNNGKIWRP